MVWNLTSIHLANSYRVIPRAFKYLSIVNFTIISPPFLYILTNIYPLDNSPCLVYTRISIYSRRGKYSMKLMIAGSRSIQEFNLTPYIPAETHCIICGGARGTDHLAEEYADRHRLSKYIIRPLYSLYGRAAPIKRNLQMVDMADAVLVVWTAFPQAHNTPCAMQRKQISRSPSSKCHHYSCKKNKIKRTAYAQCCPFHIVYENK